MENNKSKLFFWRVLSLVLFLLLVGIIVLFYFRNKIKNVVFNVVESTSSESSVTETSIDSLENNQLTIEEPKDYLDLWTDESKLKNQLTEYINTITIATSSEYIPVEDRIAVFDFDGTLFCETDPVYLDYRLFYHRVTEDENYKDEASKEEKLTASKIKTMMDTGEQAKGLEIDHGKGVASSFKGMTVDEFYDYVKEFKNLPSPSYEGMKNGEAFYKPMLQVIDYLQDNDFTVYIVTGTDRFIVRPVIDGVIDIPAAQVIGSKESVVATGQGDLDGLDYQFTSNDELVLGGDFLMKDLKMNKVYMIQQEIGKQPVLSFGNSSGDTSMANYTITNNKYKSDAYMLCCDDTERENGNEKKANDMIDMCNTNGWTPVSMKNDWTTIYGDNVTYKNYQQ